MSVSIEKNNLTVHGYHNKNSNRVGLISKSYPVLVETPADHFLLTKNHYFTTSSHTIKKVLGNFESISRFNDIKTKFANILILPGLLISIAYILQLAGLTTQVAILEYILTSNITSFFFWLSTLGVIILWHEFYKSKTSSVKLPLIEKISEKELELMKSEGIKFGRYANRELTHFLSEETISLLTQFISKDEIKTLKLYLASCQDELTQKVLKRSAVEINAQILKDANVTTKNLPNYPLEGLRSILVYALEEALLTEHQSIEPVHIFLGLTKIFSSTIKLVQSQEASINTLRGATRFEKFKGKRFSFFDISTPYFARGGIAKNWIYGYTYVLNHFSSDVNLKVTESSDRFGIGHEKEIEALVSILGRSTKKHALLIGEAGVGKSSLIKGVAQMINSGEVPPVLLDKRIVQLDVNGLIAYSSGAKNLEAVVQKAMGELSKAGNTILYIDEIQEIVPAKAESSGHSIAGILLPYILDGKFPVVGTVNHADYKKYFYTNESFRQSFTNVEVAELSIEDTIRILETKIEQMEDMYNLYITYPAIVASAELAQRYVTDRMLPDSSVNVFESAASWGQSNNVKQLTAEHVSKAVSLQTNIPVESIDTDETEKLIKIEQKIKNKVVGQDEAIVALAEALRRARVGIRSENKPMGVFLFIGPTGVGKTHLAKVLAQEYFENAEDIVRLDMSEYQEEGSVNRFLGSQKDGGYSQGEVTLLDRVKRNPYTVLLFDEIEKANPKVLDLFLQLFDEGRLTSSVGQTVDFTNTIIICTSNIGSHIMLENLSKKENMWEDIKNKVTIELKQKIRPELYNRFDKIITFSPHTIEDLTNIAVLLLDDLAKRMLDKGMTLKWGSAIPALLADKTNEPEFGARPLKRYIQEKIEGKIATEIIENGLKSGDTVEIRDSWII